MKHLKKQNGMISQCSSVVDIRAAIGGRYIKVTFFLRWLKGLPLLSHMMKPSLLFQAKKALSYIGKGNIYMVWDFDRIFK